MFIVFEGAEACGKSTQLALLQQKLQKQLVNSQRNIVSTREPGGTPLAEELRALFKSKALAADTPLPLTEAYMVMAARAQHVAKVVKPGLAAGNVVLCDRFLDSTYVYQCLRGGLSFELINNLALPILQGLKPSLTIVLQVPWQVAKSRMRSRLTTNEDRLDSEGDTTLQILEQGFCEIVKKNVAYPCGAIPVRKLIDAQGSPEEIHTKIWATVQDMFEEFRTCKP